MSSEYRTTVISHQDDWEDTVFSDTLGQATWMGESLSKPKDLVRVEEVIKDASGKTEVLHVVHEYVREAD